MKKSLAKLKYFIKKKEQKPIKKLVDKLINLLICFLTFKVFKLLMTFAEY